MRRTASSLSARLLLAMAVTGLLVANLPGTASAQASESCLKAIPLDDVTEGWTGTGWTVDHGTVPEPFSATVRGRVTDGISLGVDMIIADLDSPALTEAGGVWAGMSGSPVYDGDGRLLGAVAYGLSVGPSKIAGITPAVNMGEDLLAADPSGVVARDGAVALPKALQDRLVRAGAVTRAEAEQGMRRLPVPLAVSGGLSTARLTEFTRRLGVDNVRPFAAGVAGGVGDPASIVAGGNFAAAMSYGDLTAGAVGTTTAVCDGEALAFGHPFNFSGPATMSAHGADAVFVQPDVTLSPFKVANITGAVGTVDQDRLVGLHSTLGLDSIPATVPVTSHVTSGGRVRDGRTDVNAVSALPDLAAFHLLSNVDRVFDRIGAGTADLTWTARGKRADGTPWSLTRTNNFASGEDVSFESIFELFDDLSAIVNNPEENVTVTDVTVPTARYDGTFRNYRIGSVSARMANGKWVAISENRALKVVAGSRLNLRVTLLPYKGVGPQLVQELSVAVPAAARGGFGDLTIAGGRDGDFGDGFGEGIATASPNSSSFDGLLDQLRTAPQNNDVTATLNLEPAHSGSTITREAHGRADAVVSGLRFYQVDVVAPKGTRVGHVDGGRWSLRGRLSEGRPSKQFHLGTGSDTPVMGDWNGNGDTTPATFRNGVWTIRPSWNSSATRTFTFGKAGDKPVVGDWNGDGNDDVGVYRSGRWLLRFSADAGPADRDFTFGATSASPVAGDWNGDGIDTVGTVNGASWRVAGLHSSAAVGVSFRLGRAGDRPVVGDWDADGFSEPGVYRSGRWLLTRGTYGGPFTWRFDFGKAGSRTVTWR